MGYTNNALVKDERIVYKANLHWILFVKAIIFTLIIGLPVLVSVFPLEGSEPGLGGKRLTTLLIFAILEIILFLPPYIVKKTSEFVVTNKKVLMKTGFISRTVVESLIHKVESVQVDQGIFGRILGYGTVVFVGAGGIQNHFKRIANPLEFKNAVNEMISQDDVQRHRYKQSA